MGRWHRIRLADPIRQRRCTTQTLSRSRRELWERGELVDKAVTGFTSSYTAHGGQESTILALANTFYHWGSIIVPLGYTVREVRHGGGNPYGASYTNQRGAVGPDADSLAVARAQGRRLARVAEAIRVSRSH
jgi:NAD(P)H dehydrogenase (quinone)